MSFVSRGFRGRRRSPDDKACPAGPVPDGRLPGALRRADAAEAARRLDVLDRRRGGRAAHVDLGGVPGAARARDDHASTSTASPSGRSSTPSGRASRSTRSSTASRPRPSYVMAYCDGGYTTNLPLEDLTGGKAWVAYEYDGEPLEPEHGGPARLLVPHLYFWKSAKWVRGLGSMARRRARLLGDATATTTTATHGGSSATGATDLARSREVVELVRRDARASDARARRPGWPGHRAGPARRRPPDRRGRLPGRSAATRSPRRPRTRALELTVERLDDGEVSPYLIDELRPGDQLELRGPDRRLLRLGAGARAGRCCSSRGGSGVVPLMAMLRRRAAAASDADAAALSSRSSDDVIYRDELERLDGGRPRRVVHTLTRAQPPGWTGYARRVDRRCWPRSRPGRRAAPRLRLRADPVRRGGRRRRSSRSATSRARSRPNASDRRRRHEMDDDLIARRQRGRRPAAGGVRGRDDDGAAAPAPAAARPSARGRGRVRRRSRDRACGASTAAMRWPSWCTGAGRYWLGVSGHDLARDPGARCRSDPAARRAVSAAAAPIRGACGPARPRCGGRASTHRHPPGRARRRPPPPARLWTPKNPPAVAASAMSFTRSGGPMTPFSRVPAGARSIARA